MGLRVKRDDSDSSKLRSHSGSGHAARAHSVQPTSPSFTFSMEDAEIGELLKQLEAISYKLSMFPTEKMMYEYKCLVGELMRRSMSAYHLRKDLRWRRSDKNLYVTIEKIESDLNELEEVFQREGIRTRGFFLIEEIKGCLISLLV
ncbi:MAG: DUF327 family protein [Synergistaceae bacterium]|nr:DUF327 family protein [Synergistaceae bacterium]